MRPLAFKLYTWEFLKIGNFGKNLQNFGCGDSGGKWVPPLALLGWNLM